MLRNLSSELILRATKVMKLSYESFKGLNQVLVKLIVEKKQVFEKVSDSNGTNKRTVCFELENPTKFLTRYVRRLSRNYLRVS